MRSSTLAFLLLPLLALSLAYYVQSHNSPLGPAPHLGVSLGVPLTLSGLASLAQAAAARVRSAATLAAVHPDVIYNNAHHYLVNVPVPKIQWPAVVQQWIPDLGLGSSVVIQQKPTTSSGLPALTLGPFEPLEVDPNREEFRRRIVAVGDIHGDVLNAYKILQTAGVVNEEGNWTGEVDMFVQTGDIIDRGDDTIILFKWFEDLRVEAEAVGGRVISHMGNHEWMNVIGDWRYVLPTEIQTFETVQKRFEALTTGWLGEAWAANYTVTSRIPLHPSLGPPNTDYPAPPASPHAHANNAGPLSHAAFSFVHGGLAPQYPALAPFPSAINELGASLLRKLRFRRPLPRPHPPYGYPGLPAGTTPEEARLYGGDGPLWYRGWAELPDAVVCKQVDGVLEKTGTRRMVMGHTPNFEGIRSRCDGKIIIIDTGISHAYGGAISALSVEYKLVPLQKGGWKEQEVVKAIYAEKEEEVLVMASRDVDGDDFW
ncbi:Metallo-dependent phosphatase [Coniophora puteana RWD-64-598 SS2]|uniref:Metallo-dependent phosphatase n=1 Tax=Coniophora puteana (strain RWD-64-598) TaxID=741705 RepID=A0A5M3MY40_CONPW|nr:Metallo-dependent phosphatase [Coniophora puteana RWD-64-598 SS2]EIW83937.1 Metallo-dependent phosphatase [Coniophora puteana RWD-64-598 SS2]